MAIDAYTQTCTRKFYDPATNTTVEVTLKIIDAINFQLMENLNIVIEKLRQVLVK